jgi:NTP pyrophosphatase (non-canonical NTP hydrolase)
MYDNQELVLPQQPTMKDFQNYVRDLVRVRGWQDQKIQEVFMLFLEECGELAKAVRKTSGMEFDKNSTAYHADLEAADVLIYLLDICNRCGIDLEKAFRDKEEINKKRVWSK